MLDSDFPHWYPPISPTPEVFEQELERMLRASDVGLASFDVRYRARGSGGAFELAAVARCEAPELGGEVFVEGEHGVGRITRDRLQGLEMRARVAGLGHAVLFSTEGYDWSAVTYARARGIPLVTVADGRTAQGIRRSYASVELPPGAPEYVAYRITARGSQEPSWARIDLGWPASLVTAFQPAG